MNTLEQNNRKMVIVGPGTRSRSALILLLLAPMFGGVVAAGESSVDNDRVTVSDVQGVRPSVQHAFVSVPLSHPGTAAFGRKGDAAGAAGARTILIELKDGPGEPLANSTPYPLAFPRPGAKKLLENELVVVWQYTWHVGRPIPIHFHDKDTLVVFEGSGKIKSTPLTGESTVGENKFGEVRYNPRGRVHSEILVSGDARAVITELK